MNYDFDKLKGQVIYLITTDGTQTTFRVERAGLAEDGEEDMVFGRFIMTGQDAQGNAVPVERIGALDKTKFAYFVSAEAPRIVAASPGPPPDLVLPT
jgi:hypothetical protein